MIGHTNYTTLAHAITDNYPEPIEPREVTIRADILGGVIEVDVTVHFDENDEGSVIKIENVSFTDTMGEYDWTDAPELECHHETWIEMAREE